LCRSKSSPGCIPQAQLIAKVTGTENRRVDEMLITTTVLDVKKRGRVLLRALRFFIVDKIITPQIKTYYTARVSVLKTQKSLKAKETRSG
jgi:hypothetical protein